MIYLKLTQSQYGPCRGGASARGLTSCPLTNQFKSSVRRKTPALVAHATDSATETTDNLNALGLSYASRFGVLRASWNSLEDVLHALDAVCDYVVLRDFEGYTRDARAPDGGSDVDLLTSDFTKAMLVLGRVPAVAPWQMVGSGGHRASVSVVVGGYQVKFDVRHIGDGYMDPQWAANVLLRRVFWNAGGFYVPSNTDHFYTLFYHTSVVHKATFVHITELLPMALHLTLEANPVSAEFTAALRKANLAMALRAIGTYMDTLGYMWTKPNDPAVFFRPRNL